MILLAKYKFEFQSKRRFTYIYSKYLYITKFLRLSYIWGQMIY